MMVQQTKLSRREFLQTNMKLALGTVTASLNTGNSKGVMAGEMKDEYIIREGEFQHIVMEGTSYEVGKMQGEIIKAAGGAEVCFGAQWVAHVYAR